MTKRTSFPCSPERVASYMAKAYPRRKTIVKRTDDGVFVSVSRDATLQGSTVFSLTIRDGRDMERQIERARARAEARSNQS